MGDMSSEPSMEEILSSIKKIIAEDSGKPSVLPKRHIPMERRMADTLVEPVADPTPNKSVSEDVSEAVESDDVLELTESAPEATMTMQPEADDQLVSQATASASRDALASLSRMIVKPDVVGSDSLEAMVREMLKPMLKAWLDAKLPEIVERAVAQEVGRISGRVL
jgi:uncharacterized protein